MQKIVSLIAAVAFSVAASAQEAPNKPAAKPVEKPIDRFLAATLPLCDGLKVTRSPFDAKLPAGWIGELVAIESADSACNFQELAVTTPDGRYWVGMPWLVAEVPGTPEEKLKNYAWQAMQQAYDVKKTAPRADKFLPVTLYHVTDYGRVPMSGVMDPEARAFFFGDFHRDPSAVAASRQKAIDSVIAKAPSTGPKDAPVTVVEFSDFQCPSCKYAAGFIPSVLAKYEGKIRYVRLDLPLMSAHPWAFPAAISGRAIYRQSPEAFWKFKSAVYSAQADLSTFTLDSFVRGFVEDHGLDLKKFEADVNSDAVRQEILDSVGVAFSEQVISTPTFLVNGRWVMPGEGGKFLSDYIAKELARK